MRPEWSYDDASGRDFLIEHAIDYLEWRQDIGDPASPMNGGTDSDGDEVGDSSEFVAATGPFDPDSLPRIGISGPSPTLTWTSADRRALVILESILPTGPWVEHPASPVFSPANHPATRLPRNREILEAAAPSWRPEFRDRRAFTSGKSFCGLEDFRLDIKGRSQASDADCQFGNTGNAGRSSQRRRAGGRRSFRALVSSVTP